MASLKEAMGAATAFTITLTSLTSDGTAARQSTAIDNSSGLFLDALVELNITYPNSAVASDKAVYCYAFGSLDGTNYPENLGASDAAYTFRGTAGALTTALRIIGVATPKINEAARWGPWAVAPAFGGILPAKWGIILLNYTGNTISTASAQYREIYQTIA